jgi:hypothetical protein
VRATDTQGIPSTSKVSWLGSQFVVRTSASGLW